MLKSLLTLITALLMIASTQAQQVQFLDEVFAFDKSSPATGTWLGNLTPTEGNTNAIQIIIEKNNSGVSVKLNFIALGLMQHECTDIEIDGNSIAFTAVTPGPHMRIEGTISKDGQRLSGTAHDLKNEEVETRATMEAARTPRPTDLDTQQAFSGDFALGTVKLGVSIVIAETPEGNWVGHMDVPAQNLREYPFINMNKDENGTLTGSLALPGEPALNVTIDDKTKRMVGTFLQGGIEIKIDFPLDANYKYKELARPQHPVPPYPYKEVEFTAEHPDGFTLAGTLTIPDIDKFGTGPFPTAVMITGSGTQDRDETLLGHKPFLVIADYLTRNGIAVARFDDRGIGGSVVDDQELLLNSTTADLATDVRAVIDLIKEHENVDSTKIGLIGHSEGGMIAPMVATDGNDDIAFAVLLAGPGVNCAELLRLQIKMSLELLQTNVDTIKSRLAGFDEIVRLIQDNAPDDQFHDAFAKMAGMENNEKNKDAIEAGTRSFLLPWMKYFLQFEPAQYLENMTCPVLALNGTKDVQVWHEQNLNAIEKIMKEAGKDITAKRYEGLNHLFQRSESGSPAEYAAIEMTFDENVLQDIVDWINLKMR